MAIQLTEREILAVYGCECCGKPATTACKFFNLEAICCTCLELVWNRYLNDTTRVRDNNEKPTCATLGTELVFLSGNFSYLLAENPTLNKNIKDNITL